MRERPILFSAPMVRAILEGRKTQTRRVVKPQPVEIPGFNRGGLSYRVRGSVYRAWNPAVMDPRCPYGQTGDRLWVREAFRFLDSFDGDSPATVGDRCLLAGYPKPWAPTQYEADGVRDNWMNVGTSPGSIVAGKLRPGIHMPRWASRITLEIVAVRVERLHDISEADAIAEAAEHNGPCDHVRHSCADVRCMGPNSYRGGYAELWESINGAGSWAANPWVWVVQFNKQEPRQ